MKIKLRKRAKFAGDIFNALIEAGWTSETASSFCDSIPDADCREVVPCKDCKYLYEGGDGYCCSLHKGLVMVSEDSFCSYGERRNDG